MLLLPQLGQPAAFLAAQPTFVWCQCNAQAVEVVSQCNLLEVTDNPPAGSTRTQLFKKQSTLKGSSILPPAQRLQLLYYDIGCERRHQAASAKVLQAMIILL